MRWLVILLALVLSVPARADDMTLLGVGNRAAKPAAAYVGPGDIVSGATAFYSPRCYSAAVATGSTNVINYRRASDNSTQNGVCLTNGNFDSATAATFAGTDATASCTIASTTATCTGASSTPHVNSTVAGTGLTQPCIVASVGTFTGGAGTMTLELAGTTTSCGTVGSAETLTMTYGLFVTETYDQTGNTFHALQSTSGVQPQLLLTCATKTCIYYNSSNSQYLASSAAPGINLPLTWSAVSQVNNSSASEMFIITESGGSVGKNTSWMEFTPSTAAANAGMGVSSSNSATASTFTLHSIQGILPSTVSNASSMNVDGTITSGTSSTSGGNYSAINLGRNTNNTFYLNGYITDAGLWPVGFSTTQGNNMCHNQTYWGAFGC